MIGNTLLHSALFFGAELFKVTLILSTHLRSAMLRSALLLIVEPFSLESGILSRFGVALVVTPEHGFPQ